MAAGELRLYWRAESADTVPRRVRIDRLLRSVLAPLIDVPVEQLRFGREAKGRPFLRHDGAPDFNLSDTSGGTLIAVSRCARIGVDLERIGRQLPVARLASRWYSAEETLALHALPSEQARAAFLRLWTAKEASCKATGTGIFGYLREWCFDVLAESPRLLAAPSNAGAAERWRFLRLAPSSEHTAVLALRDAAVVSLSACYLVD